MEAPRRPHPLAREFPHPPALRRAASRVHLALRSDPRREPPLQIQIVASNRLAVDRPSAPLHHRQASFLKTESAPLPILRATPHVLPDFLPPTAAPANLAASVSLTLLPPVQTQANLLLPLT